MTEQLTRDEKTALVAVAVRGRDGTGGLSVMTYINQELLTPSGWDEWFHPDVWDWDRTVKALDELWNRQLITLSDGWRICREGRKLL